MTTEQNGGDVCETCNGHGLIGGWVGQTADGGYESEPCPDCAMTPRIDRSAYGVVIGFGGCIAILAFVGLAQLFGKFRHVMPQFREWLLVNVEAVHEVVLRWVA